MTSITQAIFANHHGKSVTVFSFQCVQSHQDVHGKPGPLPTSFVVLQIVHQLNELWMAPKAPCGKQVSW